MTHLRQIAVLIAERQPLYLDGLARSIRLDRELRLVGDVASGEALLSAVRRHAPDVVVVDADLDAIRLLRAVARLGLTTRVALLASDVRRDHAFEAVAAGARGYLSKQVSGDTVCAAIRRIAAGESVLCDEAQTAVASEIRVRHRDSSQLLTPREYEVLVLLAEGLTFAEIGARLHLATTTVKTHAGRIYERLGARDRLRAVIEGMRRGILS